MAKKPDQAQARPPPMPTSRPSPPLPIRHRRPLSTPQSWWMPLPTRHRQPSWRTPRGRSSSRKFWARWIWPMRASTQPARWHDQRAECRRLERRQARQTAGRRLRRPGPRHLRLRQGRVGLMRLTLVTPPAPFITLDEARSQCRVENDQEENAVLERAIDAAISYLDGYRGILRRCIVNQQWRMDLARPCRTVRMPFPDISDVTVTYPAPSQSQSRSIFATMGLQSISATRLVGQCRSCSRRGSARCRQFRRPSRWRH